MKPLVLRGLHERVRRFSGELENAANGTAATQLLHMLSPSRNFDVFRGAQPILGGGRP